MAKRILGLILVLAFAVAVVGCKKSGPSPDEKDKPTTPTKTAS